MDIVHKHIHLPKGLASRYSQPMPPATLERTQGLAGAIGLGLGSILGTGVFVSISLAVDLAGPSVVIAIAFAAAVAACNALSSAQLAANHPTSGGTYEYGHVYLRPWLGFTAGWMFLCAKSASAATAALGFAGYLLVAIGQGESAWRVPLALAAVVVLVVIVLGGMRRSSITNIVIVSVTLASLAFFVLAGLPNAIENASMNFVPFFGDESGSTVFPRLLEASALMFVAYTGYGRIATLGEEVRSPRRTIPSAIIVTLLISMAMYLAVGAVGIGAAGVAAFGSAGTERVAPLAVVARGFDVPAAAVGLSVGAITAMLGVLLNLILGLSRVLLAMGRRGDAPAMFGRVDANGRAPVAATIAVGLVITGIAAVGSIKLAWSFSAFTVLIYYAITNLAAIRLPSEQRLYPRWVAWAGMIGCLGLAWWVEPRVWIAGLATLLIGFVLRWLSHRYAAATLTNRTGA